MIAMTTMITMKNSNLIYLKTSIVHFSKLAKKLTFMDALGHEQVTYDTLEESQ